MHLQELPQLRHGVARSSCCAISGFNSVFNSGWQGTKGPREFAGPERNKFRTLENVRCARKSSLVSKLLTSQARPPILTPARNRGFEPQQQLAGQQELKSERWLVIWGGRGPRAMASIKRPRASVASFTHSLKAVIYLASGAQSPRWMYCFTFLLS